MSAQEKQSPEALTPKQKDILEFIKGVGERLKKFDHLPAEKMEEFLKDKKIALIFQEFEDFIQAALRAKIDENLPKDDITWDLLYRWVRNSRILGQWTRLRKIRRRFEVGVKRPLKKEQAELLEAFEEILYERGKRQAPIKISEEELDSAMSLEAIIQMANKRMVFDPNNPPQKPKDPTPLAQVHKILLGRRKIKMSRQALLRKIKRIQG